MASSSTILQRCKYLTLSFSGAGHLFPYHLGVASAIKTKNEQQQIVQSIFSNIPIKAVSGSSSGAIAAAAFVHFTNDGIKEYADRFISDGGRAMYHFKNMLEEGKDYVVDQPGNTSLHIATTRCSDGSLHLFDFPPNNDVLTQQQSSDKDHLIRCLEASCKIPQTFHPSDVLPSKWPSIYADEEGILIHGSYYVDGGISAPAPPTPFDSKEDGACRLIVSPISGSNHYKEDNVVIRISPKDDSWKFPMDITCRGGFTVHPSVQNVQAMQVSAGVASPQILQDWYERGIDDARSILEG